MTRLSQIQSAAGIPMELQRSTPRHVTLSSAGRTLIALAVFLVVAGVAGGAWLYTLATQAAAQAERRSREGVSTEAQIIAIRRTRGDKPKAILTYRFLIHDRDYTGRGSLPARSARELREGSAVRVSYLSSDPAQNWLYGRPPGGVPMPVAPLLPLATTACAAMILWGIRRQRRMLEDGRPALAQVVSSRRVLARQHSGQRIEIEFEDLSGARRRTHLDITGKAPDMGSSIGIVYDRENPGRVARYPMSLVRIAASF